MKTNKTNEFESNYGSDKNGKNISLYKEIEKIYKENSEPNTNQINLLDEEKKSLIIKIKDGEKFHSVKFDHIKDIKTESGVLTKYNEPVLMRGIMVKNLTENEEVLAKEVFGFVVKTEDGTFLPVGISKTDKVGNTLENIEISFSSMLKNHKLIGMGIGGASAVAGIGSLVNQYGIRVVLDNVINRFAGGVVMTPGIVPVLTGAAVGVAVVGAAVGVPPLTRKINEIRNAIMDKNDGDELQMAISAVSKIDYPTIISTERSDLLPKIENELKGNVLGDGVRFKKNKRNC